MAKTADAKFGKYYDSFIPGIKAIVTATAPKAGTDPQVCWLAHEGAVGLPKMIPTFREFERLVVRCSGLSINLVANLPVPNVSFEFPV